ncbi:MAG: uroporphyrinogen-III synthase [Mariprofundaceae bacterium]|nr:uroporphyrinogen-III synthase [Mariprofundaceae bacterium]
MSTDHLSLAGKRILITRSSEQAEATATEIGRRGGKALFLPCLEVECLAENIQQSLPILEDPSVDVLFTSRNAVECVASVLGSNFAEIVGSHRVSAIGNRTAQSLSLYGIKTELLPQKASQEGLIETYQNSGLPERLLFFRAEEGKDLLQKALSHRGCEVITLYPYRMNCPDSDVSSTVEKLKNQQIDALLLGSPKTVENYVRRIGSVEIADTPAIAVISPQVARAAEDAGLSVQVVAKTASFDAMLDALADYFINPGA